MVVEELLTGTIYCIYTLSAFFPPPRLRLYWKSR